jgi:GT2 family glycosyltransferase
MHLTSMIEIVSATRLSASEFATKSALGQSLQRLGFDDRLSLSIACANRSGLPDIFNARIAAADSRDVLVFMHDDVWIDDHFLVDRLLEGLQRFDVLGVAGNRRRVPNQPGWAFVDRQFTWDSREYLSGAIAHGPGPLGAVSFFGPSALSCELLDGVFLAARKSALLARDVRFGPQFDFHFYDMDFCRSARQRGLRLGTWPICLTHQSAGAFGGERWQTLYLRYLEKWGE